jgi:hypothetical protein
LATAGRRQRARQHEVDPAQEQHRVEQQRTRGEAQEQVDRRHRRMAPLRHRLQRGVDHGGAVDGEPGQDRGGPAEQADEGVVGCQPEQGEA